MSTTLALTLLAVYLVVGGIVAGVSFAHDWKESSLGFGMMWPAFASVAIIFAIPAVIGWGAYQIASASQRRHETKILRTERIEALEQELEIGRGEQR